MVTSFLSRVISAIAYTDTDRHRFRDTETNRHGPGHGHGHSHTMNGLVIVTAVVQGVHAPIHLSLLHKKFTMSSTHLVCDG